MKSTPLVGASPSVHARVAGLVALVVLATGSYAGWVASRLIVRDDPAATASHLAASPTLARLGTAASLAMMLAWLVYALLLYRLLRPAGRGLALSMLTLVLAATPIYMLNQVHQHAALGAASAGDVAGVARALDLFRFGNAIAAIFFALWLVPLGLLVWRSGFLPKWIGALLLAGSPGYLVLFVQVLFFPDTQRTLWTEPLLVVTHLAELSLLLWLLIKGVDDERWKAGEVTV